MGAKSTSTTETLTSINAKKLYQLSLVCFSFSLILFVATYNVVVTSGLITPRGEETCQASFTGSGSEKHGELLVGYKILHSTLKKESQLQYLHWLQNASFRGPKGSLKTILTTVYQTSQTRKEELDNLFLDQEPVVNVKDAPKSAMGDSIEQDVEKSSKGELVTLPSLPSGKKSSNAVLEWGIRFFLIQAQATRMIVALSTSLQKFEENEVRKQWLSELAIEFEAIRESIVDNIQANWLETAS